MKAKGSITKYRKKDGRVSWGYWFRGKDGGQITKSGFDTRSAAVDARDAHRDSVFEISRSQPSGPATVTGTMEPAPKGDTRTLSEYLDYWVREHAALRCAPATMELYRKLAGYLKRDLGTVHICDLKAANIQEMVFIPSPSPCGRVY